MGILNRSMAIAGDYADVTNVRKAVYKKKIEIIKTPMVREIVLSTFASENPPREIWINRGGIFVRSYDAQSNTYHPNGVCVFVPEVEFDYIVATAILLIFQDLYPNAYEINKCTSTELAQAISNGTWGATLTMNDEYLFKRIQPSFDISNIENTPIEALPLVLEDKYTKSTGALPKVSLILGVISVVLSLMGGLTILLSGLCSVVGGITALISIFTTDKRKKKDKMAIWGLILSILSWILPSVFAVISMVSIFG